VEIRYTLKKLVMAPLIQLRIARGVARDWTWVFSVGSWSRLSYGISSSQTML